MMQRKLGRRDAAAAPEWCLRISWYLLVVVLVVLLLVVMMPVPLLMVLLISSATFSPFAVSSIINLRY